MSERIYCINNEKNERVFEGTQDEFVECYNKHYGGFPSVSDSDLIAVVCIINHWTWTTHCKGEGSGCPTEIPPHFDVFGHELQVGDTVAFMQPGYTYALKTGTIVKFTPQKLVIKSNEHTNFPKGREFTVYKFPEQVAKRIG